MVTRTVMWLMRKLDILYVCLLHSLSLWYGCLDIGGYGCHENNLIMILPHSDRCLVWLKELWIYCTCCSLAFPCTLIGVWISFHFLLLYDQHIATFISSCYGDLYVMVVLRVAYHHRIWIFHCSILVDRNQNNIIYLFYAFGTSGE